ncbi:hypothetical protein HN814_10630, partial [Candidatus Woesearchaeota archaeon]|nr:hypothetical protein [Candidatus Woesearchaeota archaeon]
MKKSKLFKKFKKGLFVKSFSKKNQKTIVICSSLDLLFLLGILLVLLICGFASKGIINNMDVIKPHVTALQNMYGTQIESDSKQLKDSLGELDANLKSIFTKLIITIILFLFLFILNYAIWKSLIWAKIKRIKIEKNHILKFILLCFIWMLLWLFVIISLIFIIPLKMYLFIIAILILLMPYFSLVLFNFFDAKKSMLNNLKNIYQQGILKIKKLFINYLVIILTFILVTLIIFTIGSIFENKIFTNIMIIIFLVSLIYLVNWSKLYFNL